MFKTHLFGQWKETQRALELLTRFNVIAVAQLQDDGKLILEKMQGHIDSQDLGWAGLSEYTIEKKGSSIILVDSGFLRNNLATIQISDTEIYVGASNVTHPSGRTLEQLLIMQEYGTSKQPARPLVRPTFEEMKPVILKNWERLLKDLDRKLR